MKKLLLTLAALLILVAPGTSLYAQDAIWVHLRVEEDGATQVRLNLPISMVSTALGSVRESALQRGNRVARDLTIDDARAMWEAMRDAGDAEFIDVRDGDERVRIFREGDRVYVHTDDGDTENLRMEMPVEVANALLAEDPSQMDLAAAIQDLVRRGESDLVLIRDGDATVRLWADERSTQED